MNLLLIFFIAMTVGACTTTNRVPSLCRIEIDAMKCWTSKSSGDGVSIDMMDGWYALSEQDLHTVVEALKKIH